MYWDYCWSTSAKMPISNPIKFLLLKSEEFFYNFCYKEKIFSLDISQTLRENILTLLYIWLDLIQGACTHSIDNQVQGARTHPHHPWNSLPQSSASSVTIMSHSFYLAGWASLQEKFLDFELRSGLNILYQSYKISPPSPLLLTQKSQPATHTHPLLGLGLSSLISYLQFFGFSGLLPVFKQKPCGHL